MKGYIDTNVFIQFVLGINKKAEQLPSKQKVAHAIFKCALDKKFEWIGSNYLLHETHDVLMQLFYELRCIENGFAFHRERHNAEEFVPFVDKTDMEKIGNVIFAMHQLALIEEKNIEHEQITKLQKMGLFSYDSFHILHAEKSNCDYFVTWDKQLFQLNDLGKENEMQFKTKVIKPEYFLSILEKQAKEK